MPRRWRVLPELFKYISEFCIFFSPWYFPPRTHYRIQNPKNRLLFSSCSPLLFLATSLLLCTTFNFLTSTLYRARNHGYVLRCPLDYYTFLFRIFVLLVCYSHPSGTHEGPRSFQAFIQSPSPVFPPSVEPWRLILSSPPLPLFSLFLPIFWFLEILR